LLLYGIYEKAEDIIISTCASILKQSKKEPDLKLYMKYFCMKSMLLVPVIIISACIASENVHEYDYQDFLFEIQKNNTIERIGTINQPFIKEGRAITLSNETIQVFEYTSAKKAEDMASKISPDGYKIGNSIPLWVSQPNFYMRGKLIILYVGNNTLITDSLEKILGRKIAG
jgi:hypothetical protein